MTDWLKEKILDGIEDRYLSEAMDYSKTHRVREHIVIKIFGKMVACIAVIFGLSFSSLVIAVSAGNMTAYDILYTLYPDIAVKLMPVNACCEDNGIQMEVEGVSIQDNCAYVYISMQDLVGKRIDETIDLFDSYSIHSNADQIGSCSLVDFNEENKKATFLINVKHMDGKTIEGKRLTFRVSKFLTGKSEVQEELTQISLDSIVIVTETQMEEDLDIRGGSYREDSELEGRSLEYLCADDSKSFVATSGVTVTNYGFINDKLHIQVHYDKILKYDNHGYVYLLDADGNRVLAEGSRGFWDEERNGSYEEYIFDVDNKELDQYAIYGHFFTCQNLVEGEWEVNLTIEE